MTAAAPPSIKLAARMGRFKPSASQAAAQQARDLAAAGRDIISLTAGGDGPRHLRRHRLFYLCQTKHVNLLL